MKSEEFLNAQPLRFASAEDAQQFLVTGDQKLVIRAFTPDLKLDPRYLTAPFEISFRPASRVVRI
jgi:hypothetical protein